MTVAVRYCRTGSLTKISLTVNVTSLQLFFMSTRKHLDEPIAEQECIQAMKNPVVPCGR